MLRPGQILYTYLHLAPDPEQTAALVKSGAVCIAYETITGAGGGLPLLAPMSEVAGRMAIQAGAAHLEKIQGRYGRIARWRAWRTCRACGHSRCRCGRHACTCRWPWAWAPASPCWTKTWTDCASSTSMFGNRISTVYSTTHSVEEAVLDADLVVGGVLIPWCRRAQTGHARHDFGRMKKGAVVVDVAIDQGGCFETSHATTHAEPTYVVDGVVHYCVANMPGAVARTSTFALNNATIGHAVALADKGWKAGPERQCSPQERPQCVRRQSNLRGRGARSGLHLHPCGHAASVNGGPASGQPGWEIIGGSGTATAIVAVHLFFHFFRSFSPCLHCITPLSRWLAHWF